MKLPLKCLFCWPQENELGSPLMIFMCYSALRINKVKTTPFVSVSELSRCVFSALHWHPQRDLSWFQWGPWFGSGFWGPSTTSSTWLTELFIWWWAQKGRKQLDFAISRSVCRPNNYKHRLWTHVVRKLEIIKINSQLFQAHFSEQSDFRDAFPYWAEKK